MNLSQQQIADFQVTVRDYYQQSGRHTLPWRIPEADDSFDPYKILVSELMLQQTQVARVIPKYHEFLELFPTVQALADSSLAAVLTSWSGLGYNRRAKFLHQAAQMVVSDFDGVFPDTQAVLVQLPGVGKNTAGAILAYAYNQPITFIETNIRTVYFHYFLEGREAISDGEVAELVAQTLPQSKGKRAARVDGFIPAPGAMRKTVGLSHVSPREWYWSLMDYGAFLKSSGMKLNTLSKHYNKQSKFEGSRRQIRGQVIRLLASQDLDAGALAQHISDKRLDSVIADLLREELITLTKQHYHLSN
jgi:A/G-specific adenine glycosylase